MVVFNSNSLVTAMGRCQPGLWSQLLKRVFLAAVASLTAHFCCTGTAWECSMNELRELPLLGREQRGSAISADVQFGCLRSRDSPAAARGGRQGRAKPAFAAWAGSGSQKYHTSPWCTAEIFLIITKGRYNTSAGRSCTSFVHRSSTEPLLGLPQALE